MYQTWLSSVTFRCEFFVRMPVYCQSLGVVCFSACITLFFRLPHSVSAFMQFVVAGSSLLMVTDCRVLSHRNMIGELPMFSKENVIVHPNHSFDEDAIVYPQPQL